MFLYVYLLFTDPDNRHLRILDKTIVENVEYHFMYYYLTKVTCTFKILLPRRTGIVSREGTSIGYSVRPVRTVHIGNYRVWFFD